MKINKYRVLRDIAAEEPTNYSRTLLEKGTTLYGCVLCTYGCISPENVAATHRNDGGYPFFEMNITDVELI
jgi:hypothetical protein